MAAPPYLKISKHNDEAASAASPLCAACERFASSFTHFKVGEHEDTVSFLLCHKCLTWMKGKLQGF